MTMGIRSGIRCPECYSRRYHLIITQRGFSLDRAATGAIFGGLGLAAIMGIDGRNKKCYLQCDICGHVWSEK